MKKGLLGIILIIAGIFLFHAIAFSAAFTSVQDGDWADGATWGNTSPGSAGVDYPGADGDTATINHHVIYDLGDSTVTFGNITINGTGILEFPTNADSTIYIGDTSGSNNATLTVKADGELRAGTSTTPIDANYHCRFYFQRSTEGNSVSTEDGAKINLYGDADFYGNVSRTTLAASWNYSSSSLTLYASGDCTGWKPGQYIAVDKNIPSAAGSTDYRYDVPNFVIDSVGSYDSANDRTPITVTYDASISNATFYKDGYIWMLSRNVEWSDPNSPTALYGYASYTEVCSGNMAQGYNNKKIHFDEVVMRGWRYWASKYAQQYIVANGVWWNCYSIVIGAPYKLCSFDGLFYSTYSPGRNLGHFPDIVGCVTAVTMTNISLTDKKVVGCYAVLGDADVIRIESSEIRRVYLFSEDHRGNTIVRNSIIDRVSRGAIKLFGQLLFQNCTFPEDFDAYAVSSSSSNKLRLIMENCKVDGVTRPLRIYTNLGSILPLTSEDSDWQNPPSGNNWILEITPNSFCSSEEGEEISLSSKDDPLFYYFSTNEQHTITFKIYPHNWTSLDQDDIYLEVQYPSSSSEVTFTRAVTASTTFSNDTWQNLSVTFTNAQKGAVYFNLVLAKYESGAYILVDPVVMIDNKFLDTKIVDGKLTYNPPQKGPWGRAKWGMCRW